MRKPRHGRVKGFASGRTAHKSKVRENHLRARAQAGISRNRASLHPEQTSCQALLDALIPIKSFLTGLHFILVKINLIVK